MSRERGWELWCALPHLLFLMASFNCLERWSHQLLWRQQRRAGEAEGSGQGGGCRSRDIGGGGLFSCMVKEGLVAFVTALHPIYRMEETSDAKSAGSPRCFHSPGCMYLKQLSFCSHAKSTQFCRRLRFPAAWETPDTLNPSQPPPSLPPFFLHGKVMTLIKHILDGVVLPRRTLMLPVCMTGF